MKAKPRRTVTPEFRVQAVKLVTEQGMAVVKQSGFSSILDDPGPPTGTAVLVFQGILSRWEPEKGLLHRECGRARIA